MSTSIAAGLDARILTVIEKRNTELTELLRVHSEILKPLDDRILKVVAAPDTELTKLLCARSGTLELLCAWVVHGIPLAFGAAAFGAGAYLTWSQPLLLGAYLLAVGTFALLPGFARIYFRQTRLDEERDR